MPTDDKKNDPPKDENKEEIEKGLDEIDKYNKDIERLNKDYPVSNPETWEERAKGLEEAKKRFDGDRGK